MVATAPSWGLTMTEPDIEPILRWDWLCEDDLQQLAELREATDYIDDPIERADLTQLQALFEAPMARPSRHAAVGRDRAGSVIAYAWGHPRRGEGEMRYWLDWAVHPTWRYRGIGEACVQWMHDRGLDWWAEQQSAGLLDDLWLGAYVDEKLTLRVRQLQAAGFAAQQWLTDMTVDFDQVPATQLPLQLPAGVELVPFSEHLSESVRKAHNHTFSTVPGAQRVTAEVWQHLLDTTTVRADWSWVALSEAGEVVGYAISAGHWSPDEDGGQATRGWIEFLGTIPDWRGRGVARALLTQALRTFEDAGLVGAGLGVDTDNDGSGHRLFADVGFTPTERLVLMGKRPQGLDSAARRPQPVGAT